MSSSVSPLHRLQARVAELRQQHRAAFAAARQQWLLQVQATLTAEAVLQALMQSVSVDAYMSGVVSTTLPVPTTALTQVQTWYWSDDVVDRVPPPCPATSWIQRLRFCDPAFREWETAWWAALSWVHSVEWVTGTHPDARLALAVTVDLRALGV